MVWLWCLLWWLLLSLLLWRILLRLWSKLCQLWEKGKIKHYVDTDKFRRFRRRGLFAQRCFRYYESHFIRRSKNLRWNKGCFINCRQKKCFRNRNKCIQNRIIWQNKYAAAS